MANRYLFTSESVTEGHPDKIADQISDAILDEILRDDPTGRVACETLITTGLVLVAGEISTRTYVDIPSVVRRTILDIGYDRAKYGFDGATCGVTVAIEKLLISTQHREGVEAQIPDDLWNHVVVPVLPEDLYDADQLRRDFLVNPTGRFVIGGPVGDAGLTGRKIIVDTYGGMARHGGGAFSGKDPSKVDRSAAYAARYVAKNVVAAGLAERCEVQVAYAIGVAHPVSIMVETFGTEKIARSQIDALVREHFDLRPGAFREYLKLHRPIFQKTAAYGHFGREDEDFTWERTDKAEALAAAAGLGAPASA